MKTQDALRIVLNDIKPSPQHKRKVRAVIRSFLTELNGMLKKRRLSATAVVGGSFAKDTWLRHSFDVDIFVRFGLKHQKEYLSTLVEGILVPFHPLRIHGSRDYFRLKYQDLGFEIVPVLGIKKPSDAQNVTDFSPWHVRWVKQHLNGLADDILLAKQFCKANHIYGAESYINGLSGHVIDILVIHYEGFLNWLRAAKRWREKTIIDPERIYHGKALQHLNASKTDGPLVVVDPVQKDRNASAAVNAEKFAVLVKRAREFLKRPSPEFFREKRANVDELLKKGALVVRAIPREGKRDVVGAKMFHVFTYLNKHLAPFGVKKSGWEWEEREPAILWFLLRNNQLPPTMTVQGPPLSLEEDVRRFRQKHQHTFVQNNLLFAEVKRPYRTPQELLSIVKKDPYVRDRVVELRMQKAL